jgi:hypothetical protein
MSDTQKKRDVTKAIAARKANAAARRELNEKRDAIDVGGPRTIDSLVKAISKRFGGIGNIAAFSIPSNATGQEVKDIIGKAVADVVAKPTADKKETKKSAKNTVNTKCDAGQMTVTVRLTTGAAHAFNVDKPITVVSRGNFITIFEVDDCIVSNGDSPGGDFVVNAKNPFGCFNVSMVESIVYT